MNKEQNKTGTAGIREVYRRLQTFMFPPRCAMCEKLLRAAEEPEHICAVCKKDLPLIRGARCYVCSRPLKNPRQQFCPDCSRGLNLHSGGMSAFVYEGRPREAMMQIKFHGKREYIPFFAGMMVSEGYSFLKRVRPAMILAVPMHAKKRRKRGFDQAQLLAREVAELTGIPVETRLLIRHRATRAQKGLGSLERKKNLEGAFRVTAPEKLREPILLVDDIYTSGTTIDCVCRELRRHGITQIFFMTACISAEKSR